MKKGGEKRMKDIVDTAVAAGSFKTLVAAVQAAGMVETLKGKGPFTVFAPDDDAFAKLPPGTVDGLLKNVPKLRAVLMYHVIPGKLTVDEINFLGSAKTIQGQDVRIEAHRWYTMTHMNPKINDAHITNEDIVTDNGMIHVLDRVLMPNMELTCPVCGMGFMTMEDLNAHTKMGHVAEKVPEPTPPAEALMPPAIVMPVVEKAPEPLPPTEVIKEPIPVAATVTEGVFEVIYDSACRFRFHLKAANGQIIAVSQSYLTRQSAEKGIISVKKNAPMAKVVDQTITAT
jgi:uncharacterized surface protein with fasciclin (FAS1) repeats/uncharacterized protein YegP (UPF0339 family)